MTAIINTVWGGKVSQVVDRHISKKIRTNKHAVVDAKSNKLIIVQCLDALVSIAYTGIAVADQNWMDCNIASCLAQRKLSNAVAQPGSRPLARPIHAIINELIINMNGLLNGDDISRIHDLKISIVGWHIKKIPTPLAWELKRNQKEENGNRYFQVVKSSVGSFIRHHPTGLWGETLGDTGTTIDQGLASLEKTVGFTHDDVERHIANLIRERSRETKTVGEESVAVQLDPFKSDSPVQITFYPTSVSPFLTPWVLTPRLIAAPSEYPSSTILSSPCGKYVIGGFEDASTKLSIESRLLKEYQQPFENKLVFKFQKRPETP